MAHLARSCDNCSAFTYTRQLNGSAFPGSGLRGAWGLIKPFCWCPHCWSPPLSLFSTSFSGLLPTPQLFNPFRHFQWDTMKINLFSRMVVISNYFSVCYYLLLLQKCFQNLRPVCSWCCTTWSAGAPFPRTLPSRHLSVLFWNLNYRNKRQSEVSSSISLPKSQDLAGLEIALFLEEAIWSQHLQEDVECVGWGEVRAPLAPRVTEQVMDMLPHHVSPPGPSGREWWRRWPGQGPHLAGKEGWLLRLQGDPKEAFALAHAYHRPREETFSASHKFLSCHGVLGNTKKIPPSLLILLFFGSSGNRDKFPNNPQGVRKGVLRL